MSRRSPWASPATSGQARPARPCAGQRDHDPRGVAQWPCGRPISLVQRCRGAPRSSCRSSAIVIVVLIVSNSLVGIYVDWLWFGEVGFRGVFSAIIGTRAVLFAIFGLLMAATDRRQHDRGVPAATAIPPAVSRAAEPRALPGRPRAAQAAGADPRHGHRASSAPGWSHRATGALGCCGGSAAASASRIRSSGAISRSSRGTTRSTGCCSDSVSRAVFFALRCFSIAVHYLYGAIRLQTPGPKITLSARRHITILIFLFIVFKALAYWLDRYGLVYSDRGRVTGASYTDVNASLPAKTILFWIAVIIAVAVLASMWLKRARGYPRSVSRVLLILSILISGIYPRGRAAVQRQAERQRQGKALHFPKYSGNARRLWDPNGQYRWRWHGYLYHQLWKNAIAADQGCARRGQHHNLQHPDPRPQYHRADVHPAAADQEPVRFPGQARYRSRTPSTV